MKKGAKAILILMILLFNSCQNNLEKSITVFYSGCEDYEIISDLEFSVNSNKEFMQRNNILVKIDTVQNKCGYLLQKGKSKKFIESAMTDYELSEELKLFYK